MPAVVHRKRSALFASGARSMVAANTVTDNPKSTTAAAVSPVKKWTEAPTTPTNDENKSGQLFPLKSYAETPRKYLLVSPYFLSLFAKKLSGEHKHRIRRPASSIPA